MKIMPGIFRRPVAKALVLAVVVGASMSLYLAWPSLMKKQYTPNVYGRHFAGNSIGACVCTYNTAVAAIATHATWHNVCGIFSRPLVNHGPQPQPYNDPPPPDAIPAAECSSDEMMAGYKSAALTGLSAAAAAFALMMFWMRARGQKAA
jgi:hypothetical protein